MFQKNSPNEKIFDQSTKSSIRADSAPFIFFIDILKNNSYLNPIIPIPSRIDKIYAGEMTGIIFPTQILSINIEGRIYSIDLQETYSQLIENLLFYANYVSTTLNQPLSLRSVNQWWERTRRASHLILSYQEDLDFILRAYLEGFKWKMQGEDEEHALLKYIELLINYFQQKLEYNAIQISYHQNNIFKKMYKKKKDFLYPDIVKFDVYDKIRKSYNQKVFIPILVYDDLLECLLYNQLILQLKLDPSKSPSDVGLRDQSALEAKYKVANESEFILFSDLVKMGILKEEKHPKEIKQTEINYDHILDQINPEKIFDKLDELEYAQFLD